MEIENRNGTAPQALIQNLGQLNVLSADGQNAEIRVHAVQQMGNGQAIVIGEVVFRSFRGGLDALRHLVDQGPKVAHAALTQATSGLVLPLK